MVVPPMCVAAMPVGAVIATALENRPAKTCRRKEMITCQHGYFLRAGAFLSSRSRAARGALAPRKEEGHARMDELPIMPDR
eukprot:scaffold138611_cov33-Tisochrysis_lutea.AAC.5